MSFKLQSATYDKCDEIIDFIKKQNKGLFTRKNFFANGITTNTDEAIEIIKNTFLSKYRFAQIKFKNDITYYNAFTLDELNIINEDYQYEISLQFDDYINDNIGYVLNTYIFATNSISTQKLSTTLYDEYVGKHAQNAIINNARINKEFAREKRESRTEKYSFEANGYSEIFKIRYFKNIPYDVKTDNDRPFGKFLSDKDKNKHVPGIYVFAQQKYDENNNFSGLEILITYDVSTEIINADAIEKFSEKLVAAMNVAQQLENKIIELSK